MQKTKDTHRSLAVKLLILRVQDWLWQKKKQLFYLSPCASIWNLSTSHATISSPEQKRWLCEYIQLCLFISVVTKEVTDSQAQRRRVGVCVSINARPLCDAPPLTAHSLWASMANVGRWMEEERRAGGGWGGEEEWMKHSKKQGGGNGYEKNRNLDRARMRWDKKRGG